ncbi:S8 family peptidase [Limnovirga soli]|uniref:S8 family serine peptidase n=1 Tax=Limnovirga soli TaxID=2656915 RepID=A0A8J8JRZ5_9BACT|nr:S8 family peptidase [Limnovirga soli]NNV56402.1 S8 family serine peptidase [Limnovirga soli]
MLRLKSLLILLLLATTLVNAQNNVQGWHLKDPQADGFNGISLEKTYRFLKGKKSTPVIVAVIDSGIDTTQEDLKSILWVNTKEIPGNGKDDDGNGYIDDVHGWNFLGNKNGNNLKRANNERTRVYYEFKDKFDGKEIDTTKLTPDEKWQFAAWLKAEAQMGVSADEKLQVQMLEAICKSIKRNDAVIRTEMNKEEYTSSDLESFVPETSKGKQAKMGYISCLKMLSLEEEPTNKELITELDEYVEGKKQNIANSIQKPEDVRAQVIGDDYYNINDKFYGNSDVMGPDPMHGTHVSGIIAADRNNNIGINGVADNVKIMVLRAVPDGDEYDKDIALAIKYAVDNGARVINMSFGKSFSPEKKWVDEAVQYAAAKDVLLVHAAGNESHNIDSVDNFPNPRMMVNNTLAANFLTVGASGDKNVGNGQIIADFSNYGKANVDVFAPGVKIYSTLPGEKGYGFLNGTSMAAPVVTGVAALIRSYYPALSAKQVKYAIDASAEKLTDSSLLQVPGEDRVALATDISITGGFLNANAALELAATLQPENTNKPVPNKKSKKKPTLVNSKSSKN